jgi:hypothetical protein
MASINPVKVDKQSTEEAIREAAMKPAEFSPVERATYLREMIAELVPLVAQGKTSEQLKESHGEFARAYPELFKKVVGKEDLTPLRTMLGALDKMAEGKLTQHTASVMVGQKLVDTYVKPQLAGVAPNKQGR